MPPAIPGAPPPQPGHLQPEHRAANAAWTQQLEIWITPWGFLKGAAANNATARTRTDRREDRQRACRGRRPRRHRRARPYTLTGYINEQNLIERVETWVEHPVLGDLLVETRPTATTSDFGDAEGADEDRAEARRPRRLRSDNHERQREPGEPHRAAEPRQRRRRAGRSVAGAARGAHRRPTAAPAVQSEKLADGVYRITGGYVAIAVEIKDHIVVLEGGQSEARGLAVIDAAKKASFPASRSATSSTRTRTSIMRSGLAPFAAEGMTIITHENNEEFLEKALSAPRTLVGDTLAKSNRKPKVEGVGDKRCSRTTRIRSSCITSRASSTATACSSRTCPKEKILFTADFNVPAAGQPVSPSIATLVQNIDRLKLDFERHVLVHAPNPDRPLTRADVQALLKGSV